MISELITNKLQIKISKNTKKKPQTFFSPSHQIYKYLNIRILQNPYIYHESATIPTNYNAQHLYLPSAGPAIQRKPIQRIPTYVDNNIKKLKQSQQITNNMYATPLVDVVIPQQSYQLNSDVYNNEVSFIKKKFTSNRVRMCLSWLFIFMCRS